MLGYGEHEFIRHPDHPSFAATKSYQPNTQWVLRAKWMKGEGGRIDLTEITYVIFMPWRYPTTTFRHEDIGDAVTGYITHAWQCSVALLFRLFHLRHRRCPALGWYSSSEVLPWSTEGHCPTGHIVSCPNFNSIKNKYFLSFVNYKCFYWLVVYWNGLLLIGKNDGIMSFIILRWWKKKSMIINIVCHTICIHTGHCPPTIRTRWRWPCKPIDSIWLISYFCFSFIFFRSISRIPPT